MKPPDTDFSAEITGINLHRIWWTIIISGALNVAILVFNLSSSVLGSYPLAAWQIADVLVSIGLLVTIHRLRIAPAEWRGAVNAAFTVVVLIFMDVYYFILLRVYGHTAVYVLGVITIGVLLLLPPLRFLAILLMNHGVFCGLLLLSGQSSNVVVPGILEGTSAVLIAGLAQWFLYQAKWSDFHQRRIIAARNRELEQRNKEMGDVMAITAHDLRSPLQGLKHLLDFATPLGGPERLTTTLQTASKGCAEMLALIGRLLDAYAAGEAQGAEGLAIGDLRETFAIAADRVRSLAVAKSIRIDLRQPAEPALAMVSAGALAQVLDNLLANAIKFSPEGSVVTIELFSEDERWCGEVRDEGIGVPEGERDTMFNKFHRCENRLDDEDGSGLGLFIVRNLMEAMQGSVSYAPGEHGGSVFRLRFSVANCR